MTLQHVYMNNNLDTLNNFFQNNVRCLIINKNTDEVDCFYFYLMAYYAEKNSFEISYNSTDLNNETSDLFRRMIVKIIFVNSSKQIDKLLQNDDKKVIFTNYIAYKALNKKQLSINTYNFKSDVIYFLNNILGISDQTIHSHIINFPEYTYSEISKYLVNDKVSAIEKSNGNSDQILEVRKKLYQSKNDKNIDYQLFYKLLKQEVNYKKFNF